MISENQLPNGWSMKIFTDCIEKAASPNKIKIKKKDYLEVGNYPVIDQSVELIAGYTNNKNKIYSGKLPIVIFGDHTRIFKYIDFPFSLGADGTKILVPKTDLIDSQYFYFFLRSLQIEDHGYDRHYKYLKKKQIVVPPLKIQKKIVKLLKNLENLRKLRKNADALTDEYLNSLFLEMFGDPGTNTKNWPIMKAEEISLKEKNAIKAGPFGSSLKKEFYVEKGYKIYGQEQVIRDDFEYGNYYISKKRYGKLKNCKIKKGDVLISLVGTYGKISIVPEKFEPGIINPRLMKISLDQNKTLPVYFKYLLYSEGMKRKIDDLSHGGTMSILNVKIIKQLKFPIPPLELQKQFAEILQKLENLKYHQNESKIQIENLFNVLMQKSFRGELIC